MKLVKLKGYNNIYAAEPFEEEYKKLFSKSTNEYISCLKKLAVNLQILDQEGLKQSLTYQQFEKLENGELYAIRHVSKSNPRVIYAYVQNDRIILLTAFKEKSKRDYQSAISKAKDRLKELEE